jgi:uncharacterized protein (DUF488 family)
LTTLRIYTVGHSNASAGDFVALLRANGIEALVDVRSAPHSQYTPHFNRETLAVLLEDAGLAYHFAGEYLGGRPKDPTCYKHGKVPIGKVDYIKLVDYPEVARRPWFQKGLERLMQIAAEHTTTIMCSEEDFHDCHRFRLITPALERHGVEVIHIRHRPDQDQPDPNQPMQTSMF